MSRQTAKPLRRGQRVRSRLLLREPWRFGKPKQAETKLNKAKQLKPKVERRNVESRNRRGPLWYEKRALEREVALLSSGRTVNTRDRSQTRCLMLYEAAWGGESPSAVVPSLWHCSSCQVAGKDSRGGACEKGFSHGRFPRGVPRWSGGCVLALSLGRHPSVIAHRATLGDGMFARSLQGENYGS
jgi:hypothetical protein